MNKHIGWLLDLYPMEQTGIAMWFLLENGVRQRFIQLFPVTFYAFADKEKLFLLMNYLVKWFGLLDIGYTNKYELFEASHISVLSITAPDPISQEKVFKQVSAKFPEVTYYDADIPVALRHSALFGTFPLCRCELVLNPAGQITQITPLESPWELQPLKPPLRIVQMGPDINPHHSQPDSIIIQAGTQSYSLSLRYERPLLLNLKALLLHNDPDILLTAWGDRWLLPYLLKLSEKYNVRLPLNRDAEYQLTWRRERSYFSYGQVIHRDQQIHLAGRAHIDIHNAMLYHDYKMEGIYELSRITSLSLQTAARVSPGSGISAMQIITALKQNTLVPWHKQQVEAPKTASQLLLTDQGGLVYQPTIGLHQHVAELDFTSMYPSIMVHYNISPETIQGPANLKQRLASPPGLIPQTLKPLLEKRMSIKKQLMTLTTKDPGYESLKAKASAHKWLLVTCFGYLGYKNARFGRIEAHEAVTAYGREALLCAKEAAEDLGFTVLHLYVDGLWVTHDKPGKVEGYEELLKAIVTRTGLPISLEGIYNWIAFLPSRQDSRIPVANRFFGAFRDNSLKVRGIEMRRRDTPLWVAESQHAILEQLARVKDPYSPKMTAALSKIKLDVRKSINDLSTGRIPLQKLIVSQKLSRALEEYRTPSPAARAAEQLAAVGKFLRPGQMVRFIYTLGPAGVHAWDLPQPISPDKVDIDRYARLMLRAANTVLQPFTGSSFSVNELSQPLPVKKTEILRYLPFLRPSVKYSV